MRSQLVLTQLDGAVCAELTLVAWELLLLVLCLAVALQGLWSRRDVITQLTWIRHTLQLSKTIKGKTDSLGSYIYELQSEVTQLFVRLNYDIL